jgi:hypothetical protein
MSYKLQQSLGATGALVAATDILSDPCLIQTLDKSVRLYSALEAMGSGKPAPKTPTKPSEGVGLCNLQKPLNTAIFAAEHPWILPVGVAAFVGGLIYLGYSMGHKRGRKSAK